MQEEEEEFIFILHRSVNIGGVTDDETVMPKRMCPICGAIGSFKVHCVLEHQNDTPNQSDER